MKTKGMKILVVTILISGLFLVPSAKVKANTETKIALYNVVGQGLFTLVKGLVLGKVKNVKDAGRMFLYGSMAGYGFYQSKRMIGRGHVTGGVLLANLSASITENVSRGENPLAYLGYSVGPVRFQVATPLANKAKALLNVSVDYRNVLHYFQAKKKSSRMYFRNGLIGFEADQSIDEDVRGWADGIYPTVVKGVPEHVYYHEAIHAVQTMQTMSLSPELFENMSPRARGKQKLIRFSGLKLNMMGTVNALAFNSAQEYSNRWIEIEAYTLAKGNN